MAKVRSSPLSTEVLPEGEMLPPSPAEAETVYEGVTVPEGAPPLERRVREAVASTERSPASPANSADHSASLSVSKLSSPVLSKSQPRKR